MNDIIVVTLSLSSPASTIPAQIGIWKWWFSRREKPENREKNLSEERRESTTNFYLPCSNPGHIPGDLGTFLRCFFLFL